MVVVSGSVALLADTIHNFADALTALPLGLAFWLSRRPATRRYTYGYGRSEDLAGVFIVAMIALSSAVAAWEAVNRLLHPHDVRNVAWVIAAGIIGAFGNELVAVYRIRIGRKIGSIFSRRKKPLPRRPKLDWTPTAPVRWTRRCLSMFDNSSSIQRWSSPGLST